MNPPRWRWIKVGEIVAAILIAEALLVAAGLVYRRKTGTSAAGAVPGTNPGGAPSWRGLTFPGVGVAAEAAFGVGPFA